MLQRDQAEEMCQNTQRNRCRMRSSVNLLLQCSALTTLSCVQGQLVNKALTSTSDHENVPLCHSHALKSMQTKKHGEQATLESISEDISRKDMFPCARRPTRVIIQTAFGYTTTIDDQSVPQSAPSQSLLELGSNTCQWHSPTLGA